MPLTDVRVRNAKPADKAYKLSDGGGMYLLVTPDNGRYWRLDYRFFGKRRTLALGVYPAVTLAVARSRREEARAHLSENSDPGAVKRANRYAIALSGKNTFEAVAREFLTKEQKRLTPSYHSRILSRLEADIFPQIGSRPIKEVSAPELLEVLKKVEKRGAVETSKRLRQYCGQIFRYAVASGVATSDPSFALKGALSSPGRPRGHKAMSLSEVPAFLNKLSTYDGNPRTRLALHVNQRPKLTPQRRPILALTHF